MNAVKKVKPLCPPGRPPRYEDLVFAEVKTDSGETMELKMDIYQDLNQKEAGPCIVYYFGGGWMWGEYKQTTQKAVYCRDLVKLVEKGYTIVSPQYRLASEAVFPAAIHDCKAVIRFLKANAQQYHIDPDRIGVLGNSAGGHLAAMVACSAGCPQIEGDVGGNLEYSSEVAAAAIFYAPTDLVECIKNSGAGEAEKYKDLTDTEIGGLEMNTEQPPECQILGYLGEGRSLLSLYRLVTSEDESSPEWHFVELAKQCSPVTYVHENCPPMIILHGGQDPVVPISQSENFYQALTEAGADAMYLSYSKAGHGPCINQEADEMAYQFLMRRI